METLVIDCQTLPEPLFSFIGAERVTASRVDGKVMLTPETETDEPYIDGPDSDYIDPADYPDTTAYLNAIPGMVESILASSNTSASEWEEWPKHRKNHNVV